MSRHALPAANLSPVWSAQFKSAAILPTSFDLLLAGYRLLRSGSRLSRFIGISTAEFRRNLRRFQAGKWFGGSFNPFRDTDQFKSVMLYSICRKIRPKVVVETGVANGTSSFGILLAMHELEVGRLFSVELPNATYRTDRGGDWTDVSVTGAHVPANLRDRWTLVIGASKDVLPSLAPGTALDLFYHDSEHTTSNMEMEFDWAWERLRPGGILIADNVNWNGAFRNFCRARRLASETLFAFMGITRKQPG